MARNATQQLIDSALGFVRSSDTFDWLTTEAAQQLEGRAANQRQAVKDIEGHLAGLTGDVGPIERMNAVARRANAEADLQVSLAAWLRALRPDSGGGG